MATQNELAALFQRDLTRLAQELDAFTEESDLWKVIDGVSNSAGNLALHLEGNLREYVGRQLGGTTYQRKREEEFSGTGVAKAELVRRIEEVRELVGTTISSLTEEQLRASFPEKVIGRDWPTEQFLLHLFGHFNYHLGQIDYLRRFLTKHGALQLASL